jgi:hypothetical protein
MKIDRVLLSSNNNKTYCEFWNPLSKVYKEKFNIKPTLIWVGTEEEKNDQGISSEYGDIIIVEPNTKYPIGAQCTWATYWATQLFKDEVCFICGIDEVPLSGMFIKDIIKPYSDDVYLMLISDAYHPEHWTNSAGVSPSGHHVAKGSTFKKIYNLNEVFKDEIEKVFSSDALKLYKDKNPSGYGSEHKDWGIDEAYFSKVLREYNNDDIISLNNFGLMRDRRIDCVRNIEIPYDINKLKDGWYSQAHLCRPLSNHRNYILDLFNNIKQIEND